MKKAYLFSILLVLLAGAGAVRLVRADQYHFTFLPVIENQLQNTYSQSSSTMAEAASSYVGAKPLKDGRLLIVALQNNYNFVAYAFEADGSQSFIDGIGIYAKPDKIELQGCLWVVGEDFETGTIFAKKFKLPADMVCEE